MIEEAALQKTDVGCACEKCDEAYGMDWVRESIPGYQLQDPRNLYVDVTGIRRWCLVMFMPQPRWEERGSEHDE